LLQAYLNIAVGWANAVQWQIAQNTQNVFVARQWISLVRQIRKSQIQGNWPAAEELPPQYSHLIRILALIGQDLKIKLAEDMMQYELGVTREIFYSMADEMAAEDGLLARGQTPTGINSLFRRRGVA
jgi:hypothetical protein